MEIAIIDKDSNQTKTSPLGQKKYALRVRPPQPLEVATYENTNPVKVRGPEEKMPQKGFSAQDQLSGKAFSQIQPLKCTVATTAVT